MSSGASSRYEAASGSLARHVDVQSNEIEQGARVERLPKKSAGTRATFQLCGGYLVECRDEDDRGRPAFVAQAILQLKAVQPAELHVEYHAARLPVRCAAEVI